MSVYATTDLHGRYDLYLKIKELLQPEDKVFFLGDAGDRGPDGWELIKAIYEDPQFIYIQGNHEDMLADAIKAYLDNPEYESKAYRLLLSNGGGKTINDWWQDGANGDWADKLYNLPLHVEYRNIDGKLILLSHAGYTPWRGEDDANEIAFPCKFDLVWNRDHFYDEDYDEWIPNAVVVHGHTPILSMAKYLNDKRETLPHGAYWYDAGRKVCIDNLSAFSDTACLLNLDTFEEIIINA